MSGVFCDKLNLSFPPDQAGLVRDGLGGVFDMAGACLDEHGRYRFGNKGTAEIKDRYSVTTVGVSGQALAAIRAAGLFRELLAQISAHPHKVTLIHVSLDVPEYAPPILRRLYTLGKLGKVKLSRKAVRPSTVHFQQGPNEWGDDTGTVYFGAKTAETYGYVYDKSHERLQRANERWPHTTRLEMAATHKYGVSLRDAEQPSPLFYHLASPSLLPLPRGIRAWEPGAMGFELPRKPPPLPAARLRRRLEASHDIRELLKLADQCGHNGFDYLLAELRRLHRGSGSTGPGQAA
jgi:hypothetical protein